MTLDEYAAELRQRVDSFVAAWRVEHAKEPGHYPMEMEPGDWDDQWFHNEYGATPQPVEGGEEGR